MSKSILILLALSLLISVRARQAGACTTEEIQAAVCFQPGDPLSNDETVWDPALGQYPINYAFGEGATPIDRFSCAHYPRPNAGTVSSCHVSSVGAWGLVSTTCTILWHFSCPDAHPTCLPSSFNYDDWQAAIAGLYSTIGSIDSITCWDD